jgi:hypothetical protein
MGSSGIVCAPHYRRIARLGKCGCSTRCDSEAFGFEFGGDDNGEYLIDLLSTLCEEEDAEA